MQSIKSPWITTFDQFVGSIQESAMIAAPFITRQPVERLAGKLRSRRQSVRLDVLTNLYADNLIDGSLDIGALAWLCEQVPGTTVRHLRYLHAKAYVADEHLAIITSSNLTNSGLYRNRELGVAITAKSVVKDVADDLREYGNLGVIVPRDDLKSIDKMARRARDSKSISETPVTNAVKGEYEVIVNSMEERLIELRTAGEEFASDPKGSITTQFADAVRYILRVHGPLPTSEINPLVRHLKPELCDDDVDRVINGQSFGKRWKHDVRNAQQQLKRDGVIVLENRKWHLV